MKSEQALPQVRVHIIATSGRDQSPHEENMTNPNGRSKRKNKSTPAALPVIQPLVAGIDIGSSQHWVCGPSQGETPNVRVFGTTTVELNELADWLAEQGVKSVAMESTYIYWIPIYELLELRGVEVVLVNARTRHNVPGRKTDFSDCQWIQLLHSCGLLHLFNLAAALRLYDSLQETIASYEAGCLRS